MTHPKSNGAFNQPPASFDTPGAGRNHALHPFSIPKSLELAKRTADFAFRASQGISLEKDPRFFINEAERLELQKNYTARFPNFKHVFTLLEIAFNAQRNDYYRIVDLTIGFLHSVRLSQISRPAAILKDGMHPTGYVYKHWHEVCKATQNFMLLNSRKIPQEFYEEVTQSALAILNEYPDIPGVPPNDPIFFGGVIGHANSFEILMQAKKALVPVSFVPYATDIIIRELIAQGNWKEHMGKTEEGKDEFGSTTLIYTDKIVRDSLAMCLTLLSSASFTNILGKKNFEYINIDLEILRAGIEEFVELRLDLVRENYRAILDRLASRLERQETATHSGTHGEKKKKKEIVQVVGRLDDPDYELFKGHYTMLAIEFFSKIKMPMRPGTVKHKDYSTLMNLFYTKLGISRKSVTSDIDVQSVLTSPPTEAEEEAMRMREYIARLLQMD